MRDNILILVTGLPGAGKSTLCEQIVHVRPDIAWVNADKVRAKYDDWDFSPAGRLRQTARMTLEATTAPERIVLVDQVCPEVGMRALMNPDRMIFVNCITADKCRFPDTAKIYQAPTQEELRKYNGIEISHWIPNDSVKQFIDAFQPPYRVSNGRLAHEYQVRQAYEALVALNNPEGIEAFD